MLIHEHARKGSSGFHAGICVLIKDGIAAGELIKCDASRLARALQATLNGSILGWAIPRREFSPRSHHHQPRRPARSLSLCLDGF